jgi:GT2 family glycosyltransferase
MNSLAPIVLFVYNRPEHTLATLQSLKNNDLASESTLFIYADGPKNNASKAEIEQINKTRNIIKQEQWCKEVFIIESETNKGLANSIVNGVTEVVNKYGKIIVLEDDLILSKGTLQYFNDALTLYEKEEKVMHISAYMFPVNEILPETFFYNSTSCWGWATWKRSWKYFNPNARELLEMIKPHKWRFNIDGSHDEFYLQLKNNADDILKTWAVKWYASVFLKGGLCLHPSKSMVVNIGHDGSGENSSITNKFNDFDNLSDYVHVNKILLKEHPLARKAMVKYYLNLYPSFKKKMLHKIFKIYASMRKMVTICLIR